MGTRVHKCTDISHAAWTLVPSKALSLPLSLSLSLSLSVTLTLVTRQLSDGTSLHSLQQLQDPLLRTLRHAAAPTKVLARAVGIHTHYTHTHTHTHTHSHTRTHTHAAAPTKVLALAVGICISHTHTHTHTHTHKLLLRHKFAHVQWVSNAQKYSFHRVTFVWYIRTSDVFSVLVLVPLTLVTGHIQVTFLVYK